MTHIGRKRTIGIAIENIAGTAKEPTAKVPFLDLGLEPRHTPIGDVSAKGTRMEQGCGSVEGKKWGEGSIQTVLDPVISPYLLALALGDIQSASAGAGKYKHTITKSEDEPLTASIYVNRVIAEETYSNAVVNSLELTFADDVANLNANILSKFPTDESGIELEDAEECPKLYTFAHAKVKIGDDEADVRNFSLSITNNAEALYAPNSNDINEIVWKSLSISGSISMAYNSIEQRENYKELEKQAMEITFSAGDDDEIKITIPRFRIDNWNTSGSNDDVINEEMDFVVEDHEDGAIKIEVTNKIEEYITDESL